MVLSPRWPVATAILFAASVSAAQDVAPPAAPAAPPDCDGRAGRYASDKGGQLWVTRRGALAMRENPLRPLSQEEYMVLQVVVNGRIATAWGPDETSLRQGGAAKDVEREGTAPIRWDPDGKALPPVIRVIAEDGTVLAGPMRLAECGDAPAGKPVAPTAAPVAAASRPNESRTKTRGTAAPARPPGSPPLPPPGLSVPQGAIP